MSDHWQVIEGALTEAQYDAQRHVSIYGDSDGALARIDAALAFVREMRQGVQPYSHRNGESEPPTEFGFYWVKFYSLLSPSIMRWGVLQHNEKWVAPMLKEVVAFYGPIALPDDSQPKEGAA